MRIVPPGPHPADATTSPVATGDPPEGDPPHDHHRGARAAQGRAPRHLGRRRLRRRRPGLRARRRRHRRRRGRHRAGRGASSTSPPAPATPRSRPPRPAPASPRSTSCPSCSPPARRMRTRPAWTSSGWRATRRPCPSPTPPSTSPSPCSASSSRRATRLTAAELVRVTRPGGRIVLAHWTPAGFIGSVFRTMGPYMPKPPAGAGTPPQYGDEAHVRSLFARHGVELSFERHHATFHADSPDGVGRVHGRPLRPGAEGAREARRHRPLGAARGRPRRALRVVQRGRGRLRTGSEYIVVKARRQG